ncbi:M15 family metallopeptidase [Streptomyces sp. HNM0575]|uniref:M15 family metallopeptidase n=1 Tax=Streptomyces sp. HNM0575 TaxID=2716338 RepID=UPI00145F219B|nr:M15 family metallopeptidase [Streptomyces sp. HNM0575]NLU73263.1 M15 family metallopeptidase [Streptomyces sp. HNM0575]
MGSVILLGDPRVASVPVAECGEPLVEIASASSVALDGRERDATGAYGRVRAGVLSRLCSASDSLPDGVRLLAVEGHRTRSEQERRFALRQERLRAEGVTGAAELRRLASEFVAPVEVAPHCAGAAVDLTLAGADGTELDMGGPVNGHRTGDERSCPFDAPGLSGTARRNRGLLARAMRGAGFVNYPTEWWHWSYGDRYWALVTGAGTAVYGPV